MAKDQQSLAQFLLRNRDVLLPVAMVGILLTMVIPIPPALVDVLLAISIASAVMIMFVGIYSGSPMEFSVFPSLLLLTTLFRLSLNVATTRLILLHGNEGTLCAGHLINTFGNFVIGGNYVVGIVIFSILVIINFVVITKGSMRIGEVAARFTLDAMPGRQMSIDADLNAGLIDEAQARDRRAGIEKEADFYGAMDGAGRFVRGDAVAGIIITLVNIAGGLVIGLFQHGMTLVDAARNYTLLTVGEGLAAQIPALIISSAAGIVVSRASGGNLSLGEAITSQLFLRPRPLGICSAILFLFMMIPGMPKFAFFSLALVCGTLAYFSSLKRDQAEEDARKESDARRAASHPPALEPEAFERLLPLDPIALEVGYGLIALVDEEQNGELLERIKSVRRQFALEMGFVVPPIRIRDNLDLRPGGYAATIRGCEVARGELMLNRLLCMAPEGGTSAVDGVPTKDPAFGLPALWIPERDKARAKAEGMTVVDHATAIATHLTEILRGHAAELLGRQDTQALLDTLTQRYPKILEGIVPDLLSLGTIQKILQNLLRERVSIRDLQTILETAIDRAVQTKDPDQLSEFVRQALARSITQQHMSENGRLYVMMLDQEIEEALARAVQPGDAGRILALDPRTAQGILNAIQRGIEAFAAKEVQPILACLPAVRLHLHRLTERFFPNLVVLAHSEIAPNAHIESLGVVRLTNAA